MLKFFVKTVVTGFALAMGAAVFKKAAPYIRLDEKPKKDDLDVNAADASIDPGLHVNTLS